MFDFRRQTEEKFPEIDIRQRPSDRDPGHSRASFISLQRYRRSFGTDELKLSPALAAAREKVAPECYFIDLPLIEPIGYPMR